MNRQTVACLAACAAVLLTVGVIDKATNHPAAPAPHPRPSPTVRATDWRQLYADAQTAVDANAMALRAATVTGQPITRLLQQWCTAATASNTADQHLGATRQISTKDCK